MTFWGSFFLLNSLLFLPIYWFFRPDISFWPWAKTSQSEPTNLLSTLFLQRENLDIFRLNLELLLLVLVWLFVPPVRGRWYLVMASFLYFGQIFYAVYEGFIRSYYLIDPVFYNDFYLFAGGTGYVLTHLHLSILFYLGILLTIVLLVGFLVSVQRLLFVEIQPERLSQATKLALVLLSLMALSSVFVVQEKSGLPETAVSSFAAKINLNIQLSRLAKADAARFDSQNIAAYYDFTDAQLQTTPDIYIIFIESYGTVLNKRSDYQNAYQQLLAQLNRQLEENNWHTASTRSTSPTWGGGSWLAYTSALSGLRIESHAEYLALFSRYYQEPYPHLFNYLKGQGYGTYWLSSNSDQHNDIEWQRYKDFYGIDEWLRFNDMQYDGPLYGWGPSPPDQYAINFVHQHMNQIGDAPHIFFYITQNSHYPWSPLPAVASDWQAFNDLPQEPSPTAKRLPHDILRQHYLASIEYELTMLTDFITKEGDDNDIFVLIGDHQPARVARYDDGWDTPMHIISKNKDFVESFHDYGFRAGLKTYGGITTMHHEGFYSLFVRNLLQEYGRNPQQLPVYRPQGIPLN